MKRILLMCAVAAWTLGVSAQKVANETAVKVNAVVSQTPVVQVKGDCKVLESKTIKNGLMLQTCKNEKGVTFKRIIDSNKVKASHRKQMAKAPGGTLSEDFEGYTSEGWLPEGWTTVSKAEDNPNPWAVVEPFSFFGDAGNQGTYACEAAFSQAFCDEWLITPSFTVQEDDQLVFLGLIDLFFMLDYNYLDWETGEYSEKVPTAVLKIWATEDGENWTLVKDYFEDAASMTYDELMDDYMDNGGVYASRHVDLGQFAGKTIQLAFQYVGTDGNPVGIDAVSIEKPSIECSYEFPLWAPFYGITRQLMGLNISVPVLPVYQPITWKGVYDKSIDDAFAYWIYYNAESEMDFAMGDELTTSYVTDYSSEFTARNNLFYPPTFCVSAEGWTDGEFQKYTYFQSGGRADWENRGEILTLGLSAYDPAAEGHTNANGPGGIAIFGTGEGVDDFWTKQLGESGHLSAVSNICYTPEHPIAFREIYTQAKASGIKADAVYTLDIMPVTDDWKVLAPVASATIKGSDAYVGLDLGTSVYYTFNFDFGETLVLDKKTIGENRYMIRWSGLHDSADELSPMQSYWESQKGVNHGYIWLETTDGKKGAILPIDQYTGVTQGFGIMIDGWFPWLEAEETELTVGFGETANVMLDSFYPCAELKVEAPEGLDVKVVENDAMYVGAEHQPTMVVENKGITDEVEVVVSAPGVSQTFKVRNSTVGIASAEAKGGVSEVYNMQGVKMNSKNLPAGVYLMKMSDGTSHKAIVK